MRRSIDRAAAARSAFGTIVLGLLFGSCVIPIDSTGASTGTTGDAGGGGGGDGQVMQSLPPLPSPQTCAGMPLPAPGTWDTKSISPVVPANAGGPDDFSGKSTAIIVDPFDAATVWLGTGDKGLFKSSDCGTTWVHVNTGTNGDALDRSVLWSMVVDPVNQGIIYTVAAYGAQGLWKSTNGGVDWTQLFPTTSAYAQLVPDDFVGNVSMDSANPLHLAVASHGTCNAPDPLGCIAESFDGGMTWPNIVSTPAGWGEQSGVQVVDATTWIWGSGGGGMGLYLTADNGKTWKQALPGGAGDANGEYSILPLKPASDGAYYASSSEGVVRSADGVSWSLAWGEENFIVAAVRGIAVSESTIYASLNNSFYGAPLSGYASWSQFSGPVGQTDSADFLAYDQGHRLLYASCWGGGLFRTVMP
jgi:hypothetical protein